jgi:hypothetical protein
MRIFAVTGTGHGVSRALLIAIAGAAAAGAQQPVRMPPPRPAPLPVPSLGFDSLDIRRLLTDAVAAVREGPAAQRSSLLASVGRIQVEASDFEGAERTVALSDDAAPADVLRQLGQPGWFAMFDRASVARRLVCSLRAAGRPDDALSAVRRMPAGPLREWLLAHEAVMTMQPAGRSDSAVRRARSDTTRARTAHDVIREIVLPEARLDALIMLMESVADTGAVASMLRDAYKEARSIRLTDRDRQASRDARLVREALRIGRRDDALALFAGLSDLEDLSFVLHTAAQPPEDDRLVRAIAPRVVAAGRAIADSAARAAYLGEIHASLEHGGGRAVADRFVPEARVDSARTRADSARTARDDARLAATYPEDAATHALERGNYAEVRRQVERIPLGKTGARRAAMWSELAWLGYSTTPDSAKMFLGLGRASLRRAGVLTTADSIEYDRAADEIATRYFWFGDVEHGIEMANAMLYPDAAASTFTNWGASTFPRPSVDSLRAYVDRASDRRVRDAALARFVAIELVPVDVNRARALADSIATPESRAAAHLAVANALRRQRDTSATRRAFTELLSDSGLTRDALGRDVLPALISFRAWRDAETWAHSAGDPAERARRLVAVAQALTVEMLTKTRGYYVLVGNGPDACLDVF